MCQCIISRLPEVPLHDLAQTQASINQIMLQEAAARPDRGQRFGSVLTPGFARQRVARGNSTV